MKKCYIYTRSATEKSQTLQADSLNLQLERCLEHANSHGFTVIGVFSEYANGIRVNPQLTRLMTECKKNPEIAAVIITDYNRISRDIHVFARVCRELTMRKIKLISLQVHIPTL